MSFSDLTATFSDPYKSLKITSRNRFYKICFYTVKAI